MEYVFNLENAIFRGGRDRGREDQVGTIWEGIGREK